MEGFKCDVCSKPIYGTSMVIANKFYHPECKTIKEVKEKKEKDKDKELLKMS